jgi:hypothetical protein
MTSPGKDHPMRLRLAALALLALTGAGHSLTPVLYPEVTLRGAEARTIPETGVTLQLTGITDQRCPPEVDCFWEGMIRAEIAVTSAAGTEEIVLCNLCEGATDLATAGGLTIGLVGLAPSTEELAKLGRAPVLGDYLLTVNYGPAD